MQELQSYGGDWTKEKLDKLQGYLSSYMTIMKAHSYFTTVYVDAFAGTGTRTPKNKKPIRQYSYSLGLKNNENYNEDEISQIEKALKGSTVIALETNPQFNKYIFVEKSRRKCKELQNLCDEFPSTDIQIENRDAGTFLKYWCANTDWSHTRAVVFLDPFGMQVDWSVLEAIAKTQAIDLWILVPLGLGPNRLLETKQLPRESWANKLTDFFGNDEWKEKFYTKKTITNLFDEEETSIEKNVDYNGLKDYFLTRLNDIFPGVADNPLTQKNATNSPMFLLCFATSNPKKSVIEASLRISEHLLGKRTRKRKMAG